MLLSGALLTGARRSVAMMVSAASLLAAREVSAPSMALKAPPQSQTAQQPPQRRCVAAAAAGGHDRRRDRYASLFSKPSSAAGQEQVAHAPAGHQQQPADVPRHQHQPVHFPHHQQHPLPHNRRAHLEGEAPVEPSVLDSRKWLQGLVPLQQFRAVGVSFEDRQALIPQLRKDQALAFVREPDNVHDPDAVAIRTLSNHSVGYISRDLTSQFMQPLCFGWVGSVGQQGDDGLWGLTVLVQPTLPPVEVHAFPANLQQHVSLGLHLAPEGGQAWAALKQATIAAAQGRCCVTGGLLAGVHERWQFDDERGVLRLVGFRAEAPEVQRVGGLLEADERSAHALTALLQQLNCWEAEDAQAYLDHQRSLKQRRSERQWRLDLSLLAAHGVPIPPALQELCVQHHA